MWRVFLLCFVFVWVFFFLSFVFLHFIFSGELDVFIFYSVDVKM